MTDPAQFLVSRGDWATISFKHCRKIKFPSHINGLVQERRNSSALALTHRYEMCLKIVC